MANSDLREAAARKLAELSQDLDELEHGRILLLERLEKVRAELYEAGQRTASMRASVDLFCEHITDVAAVVSELRALEHELLEIGQGFAGGEVEVASLSFEAEGFQDMLREAEDDLERVSSVLSDGKARHGRGH